MAAVTNTDYPAWIDRLIYYARKTPVAYVKIQKDVNVFALLDTINLNVDIIDVTNPDAKVTITAYELTKDDAEAFVKAIKELITSA